MKTLRMKFATDLGKSFAVSLNYAREDVTATEVENAMQAAIDGDIFDTGIASIAGAELVHQNYRNRPYFHDALGGDTGRFYGVGKTTGEPGLFVSAPVHDNGRVIGVVAVKVRMEPIANPWEQLRDPVFVTDARGIVFLGSEPSWLYRTSRPVPAAELQGLLTQGHAVLG